MVAFLRIYRMADSEWRPVRHGNRHYDGDDDDRPEVWSRYGHDTQLESVEQLCVL